MDSGTAKAMQWFSKLNFSALLDQVYDSVSTYVAVVILRNNLHRLDLYLTETGPLFANSAADFCVNDRYIVRLCTQSTELTSITTAYINFRDPGNACGT